MSRAATSRLKVNPQLGTRPSLEFRRVTELRVDLDYQRSCAAAAGQTLIRRIAMFWDWSLCQPLVVAKRADGALRVVDGQHRLEAARLRGDIFDLPCVVTTFANAGEEAAAFVALNQQRRPLSKIDLFRAALAAEDDAAVAIVRLLHEAGLSLAPHTNFTAWKPGMVSNIGGIQDCYRVHGEQVTAIALAAMAQAFKGQVLRYAGTIFPGIYGFVAEEVRVEGRVDLGQLVAALASLSQVQWKTRIGEEQARLSGRRSVAARVAIGARYKASSPRSAPVPLAPSRASKPMAEPIPSVGGTWCDQCDRRVSSFDVGRCRDRFCKARVAA